MAHRNQRPHIARGRFLPDSLIQINSPNYSTRIQQVRKHAAAAVLDTDDGFLGFSHGSLALGTFLRL